MIINKHQLISMVLILSMTASQGAVAKTAAKEPSGAERAKQFNKVIADCRKRFGGGTTELSAEWTSHYGRTGWWCVTRG